MTNTIILFITLMSAAYLPATSEAASSAKPHTCSFFTQISAEKLLGEKATAVDSEESKDDGSRRWNCTFTGESGRGKIYFGLFKDAGEEAARAEFQKIRVSNQKHEGFEDWPGVGDEAVAHTDGKNFHFVMVRKGDRTIRIKLNPVNGSTLGDLKTVASLLAGKLK